VSTESLLIPLLNGLRLSQATWSKSGNLLRNSSQVLASAEHYLSATGAILQDLEGEGIAEIKSLLLQLDKALGTSQVLVSGALANLTLSKRSEISDKPSSPFCRKSRSRLITRRCSLPII
jgi:hypothetical protein